MIEIEELVQLIQAGERERLMELWERVRRFAAQRARSVLAAGARVEMDDLLQAAFLALLDAVKDYDPASGYKFLSVLGNHLKKAFAEATGYRTEKQRNDPLHNAGSMNQPLGDDEDGDTVGDLVADPADPIEEAEERMFQEWLRDRIEKAVAALPLDQQEFIRLRFYGGRSMEQIASALGGDRKAARQLQDRAFRALRHSMYIRDLRQYVEDHTNYYIRAGVKSGRSPVEDLVIRCEKLSSEWESLMDLKWDPLDD